MRLLNINCLPLLSSKFNFGSSNSKVKYFSSTSIAGDQIVSGSAQADFIEPRLNLWNKLKNEYDERLKAKANEPIKVKLKHGQVFDGFSWQSTPNDVYRVFNKHALKTAIVAKVNDELWDLSRPLEKNCEIELLNFENSLAKEVLWHSSAHVLGYALEKLYGCLLVHGPATPNGFFYDVYNNGKIVSFQLCATMRQIMTFACCLFVIMSREFFIDFRQRLHDDRQGREENSASSNPLRANRCVKGGLVAIV